MRGLVDAIRPSDPARRIFAGSAAASRASIVVRAEAERERRARGRPTTTRPSPRKEPLVEPRSETRTPSVGQLDRGVAARDGRVGEAELAERPGPDEELPDAASSMARAPASCPSTTTTSKLVGATGTLVVWRRVSPSPGGRATACADLYHATALASRAARGLSTRTLSEVSAPRRERSNARCARADAAGVACDGNASPQTRAPATAAAPDAEEDVEEQRVGPTRLRLRLGAVGRARRVEAVEIVLRRERRSTSLRRARRRRRRRGSRRRAGRRRVLRYDGVRRSGRRGREGGEAERDAARRLPFDEKHALLLAARRRRSRPPRCAAPDRAAPAGRRASPADRRSRGAPRSTSAPVASSARTTTLGIAASTSDSQRAQCERTIGGQASRAQAIICSRAARSFPCLRSVCPSVDAAMHDADRVLGLRRGGASVGRARREPRAKPPSSRHTHYTGAPSVHMHSGLKICLPSESIEYGGIAGALASGGSERGGCDGAQRRRVRGCAAEGEPRRSAGAVGGGAPVRSGAGIGAGGRRWQARGRRVRSRTRRVAASRRRLRLAT